MTVSSWPPGGRAVAPGAAGQAFEGVIGEFAEQDGIIQQGEGTALDSESKGFDQGRFGFGAGEEGADGQPFPHEGFDIGFADAVGFGPDDAGSPVLDEGFEAVALEFPADLIEAVEGDHYTAGDIDDGDGGEIIIAPPVDPGDVGVSRLGGVELIGGDGVGDAAKDLAAVVAEVGFVLGFPDLFRAEAADVFEFGGGDERVIGAVEMEGSPVLLGGIEAELAQLPEPVAAFGCAEDKRLAEGGGEHGADDFDPKTGVDEGGFVEDGEIEPFAAQVIGMMGAADRDHAAVWQIDAAFVLADFAPFQVFDSAFQVAPDLIGHLVGRRQPPAAFVLYDRRDQNGRQRQFRFPPATAASHHFEAGRVLHHPFLPRVEPLESDRRRGVRSGWSFAGLQFLL